MKRWEIGSRVFQNPATTYHPHDFPPYLHTTRIIIRLFLKDTLSMESKSHMPYTPFNKHKVELVIC